MHKYMSPYVLKSEIYINRWLSLTVSAANSWDPVDFLSDVALLQFILLFKAILLLVTLNYWQEKRIAVEKNLTEL